MNVLNNNKFINDIKQNQYKFQIQEGGSVIWINPDNLPNGDCLPDVIKIEITFSQDADISDLWLRVCKPKGMIVVSHAINTSSERR